MVVPVAILVCRSLFLWIRRLALDMRCLAVNVTRLALRAHPMLTLHFSRISTQPFVLLHLCFREDFGCSHMGEEVSASDSCFVFGGFVGQVTHRLLRCRSGSKETVEPLFHRNQLASGFNGRLPHSLKLGLHGPRLLRRK